jgi:hypothetical protein
MFDSLHAAVVDWSPVVNVVWDYAVQVMPLLVVAGLTWGAKYLGVTKWIDSKLLHDMLQRAVDYGVARADTAKDDWGPIKTEVANQVLADALTYVVKYAPDMIDKYKLAPEDVVRLLMAKLPPVEGTIPPGTSEAVVEQAVAAEEVAAAKV